MNKTDRDGLIAGGLLIGFALVVIAGLPWIIVAINWTHVYFKWVLTQFGP